MVLWETAIAFKTNLFHTQRPLNSHNIKIGACTLNFIAKKGLRKLSGYMFKLVQKQWKEKREAHSNYT